MQHLLTQLPHLWLALDNSCSKPIGPGGPGLYNHLCSGGNVSITALPDTLVLIANIIAILLYLSGGLGVIFLIVGGLYYIFSAGDPGRLKRAKEIITTVITGLVIILGAYAVVSFIASTLLS